MNLPGVYVNCDENLDISSKANGTPRDYVVTPRRHWGLGLGATAFKALLRVDQIDTNTKVELKLQWSVDGAVWQTGQTLIASRTTVGPAVGESTVPAEQVPFVRFLVTIEQESSPTSQVDATISVWAYARYA